MTHSDVQAIGWIVVRDVGVDVVRAALGARRRISPAEARALGQRWEALQDVLYEQHWRRAPFRSAALGTPLTESATQAAEGFVEGLMTEWPERYGAMPLRRRLRDGLWLGVIGLMGATVAYGHSIGNDVSLVLVMMALWNLAFGIQVLRLYAIVRGLEARRDEGTTVTGGDPATSERQCGRGSLTRETRR